MCCLRRRKKKMNQQQLIQSTVIALAHTFGYDDAVRLQAEAELEKFKSMEAYSQVLLRILASNEVNNDIKNAASIFLKNMVVQKWRGSIEDEVARMSDIDAQFIKDNLLEALVQTTGPVKRQIQHMIEIIANRDFPEKWPLLLERSIEYINSGNDQLVLNGIIGLQLGIKKFQFVPSGEKRIPLIAICERVIPLMLNILDTLANAPSDNLFHCPVLVTWTRFQNDAELWEEDPHEYLRSQYDAFKDVYSPRNEAHSFIQFLVEKRGRQQFDNMIALCMQVLHKYSSTADPAARNAGEKYGALAILGHLSDYLKGIAFYRGNLETMLVLHVFPELQSPLGYMRGQACWAFAQFYNIPFSNVSNFSNALRLTLNLLGDADLPVRVRAGTSICNLVRSKQGTDELRPVLSQLLDRLFALMNDIESDDLVTSIDSIIRRFKYEIGPYAISLTQRLCETFMRLCENEDDDSGMAANECMSALQTISRALAEAESPELYAALEPIVVPFLQKVLTPEQLLFIEPACNILTFFTYYPKKISPLMWTLFPSIIHVFNEGAFDMIDSMVDPLDNFISYGTEHFLTGGPYLESIVDMYKRVLGDINMPAFEAGEVCKIMESVLQRCRGRVDHIIPHVLETACGRLLNTSKENEMSKELTVYLLEQVSNCLFYNAAITVDFLMRHNLVQPVFIKWFASIKLLQRFYDKKICLLGLCSMLAITPTPAFVVAGSTHIIANVMEMMKYMLTIEKQIEKEGEKKEGDDDFIEQEEDEDDDDDEEHMFGEGDADFQFNENADHEDVDDPEERHLDQLEQLTMFLDDGGELEGDGEIEEAEFEGEDLDGDNEDEEEDELFENEQGGGFETPIDDVDELEFLINSFKSLFTNSPQLEATLTPKQQQKIKKYIDLIPIRKAKEARQKQLDAEDDAKRSAEVQAKKNLGKN
ncbi:hypothetical protein DFA_01060 [Cavenderia fasciculata]|uniref:Importin N-terminal domain-containing protein n=1 Tax=Cavenderia fasciculata TaxID=261658 RepID=F4PQL8_CACFS|nr:uncharacterized protein DFA_01060 [Cavenderia fasciculata]EGG21185.1 hypothetical protein DFA_01060 [Cavenderia fasciculata]|eukprot:XP_004359035.1 hypothetical protein DFA_01060 [Cavenderia fasciculata]